MPVISGGVVTQPGHLLFEEVTFTEAAANNAAGSYSGSVTVPAGAYLVDVIVHGVALWDSAGAVTMIVGDATDDNGIFTGVDLKATNLLAGEGLSASGVAASGGGVVGADLANSQWNRRYLATSRVITGKITCAAASGSAGRTRMTVIYTDPTTATAATFTAA